MGDLEINIEAEFIVKELDAWATYCTQDAEATQRLALHIEDLQKTLAELNRMYPHNTVSMAQIKDAIRKQYKADEITRGEAAQKLSQEGVAHLDIVTLLEKWDAK